MDSAADYLRDHIKLAVMWYQVVAFGNSISPGGVITEWEGDPADGTFAPVRTFEPASLEPGAWREHRAVLGRLAKELEELADNAAFATAVELRLSAYDPGASDKSLSSILDEAVIDEIQRRLGPIPRAPTPNQRSLGVELRRRFKLPPNHAERLRLEDGLARLPEDQAAVIRGMYGEGGGWKSQQRRTGDERRRRAAPGNVGGTKISSTRKAALDRLLQELPELRWYSEEWLGRSGAL